MMKIYKTDNESTNEIFAFEDGTWINMINPSPEEITNVRLQYDIDEGHLKAALDEEESPRIDVEDESTLFIVDVPIPQDDANPNASRIFSTVPLGIIIAENVIVTVCTQEIKLINDFIKIRMKGFYTFKKTRMILQIMYKTATQFLFHLKQIERIRESIENELHQSMKNEELIQLLSLEKSLVYFTTSLKANEIVFEKMLRLDSVKKYQEDRDLLEDLIIENKQAIEMASIYGNILNGTMGVVGTVINNNLNMVMKLLTSITIVMAIPTIISSFMGMNVPVPFANHPQGFLILLGITLVTSLLGIYYMVKKEYF